MKDQKQVNTSARVFIFFDVDGVLIDGYHHNPTRRKLWNIDLEKDMGIPPQDMNLYFEQNWSDVLVGKKDLFASLEHFLHENDYDQEATDIIAYWFQKDSKLNHEAWQIVTSLDQRGTYALYLATNQEHQRARYLWDTLNFKSTFRDIFYSGAVGISKKDPAFFKHVTEKLEIQIGVDQVLFFDDTPECVDAARACGWDAIQIETATDIENTLRARDLL